MKIESIYFTFALNYYLLGIIFRYILSESNQIFSIRLLFCSTMHEVMRCYIPVIFLFLLYSWLLRYSTKWSILWTDPPVLFIKVDFTLGGQQKFICGLQLYTHNSRWLLLCQSNIWCKEGMSSPLSRKTQ